MVVEMAQNPHSAIERAAFDDGPNPLGLDGIKVIVNAQHSRDAVLTEKPVITALALRVREVAAAHQRALLRGA